MKRREFIKLLGGAAAAWPLAARAQQAALPTIGLMGANNPSVESRWVSPFVGRLRELGWIEGRTVAIERRWAEGRAERAAEIAAELVRLKVDVIVTYTTTSALAAKQATSVIPIVLATSGDPIGTGLVASLVRPGGNITGSSIEQTDLAGKRLELLRELIPGLRRSAVLTPYWICEKFRQPPAGSVLRSSHLKSEDPRILRPTSIPSRVMRRPFTSVPMPSSWPIVSA